MPITLLAIITTTELVEMKPMTRTIPRNYETTTPTRRETVRIPVISGTCRTRVRLLHRNTFNNSHRRHPNSTLLWEESGHLPLASVILLRLYKTQCCCSIQPIPGLSEAQTEPMPCITCKNNKRSFTLRLNKRNTNATSLPTTIIAILAATTPTRATRMPKLLLPIPTNRAPRLPRHKRLLPKPPRSSNRVEACITTSSFTNPRVRWRASWLRAVTPWALTLPKCGCERASRHTS
mmetsp:Transcript_5441/g.12941  ORF Transcript_5441/g.12941 Transcript_5441/m.12941 type:complete len:235 (+) Transcript_5441:71-775(+)